MATKLNKNPPEWVDGKIVLGAPPALPMSGFGNFRLQYSDLKNISRCLFFWFFNKLDSRHKAKIWINKSKVSFISHESAKLLKKHQNFFEQKYRKEIEYKNPKVKNFRIKKENQEKEDVKKASEIAGVTTNEMKTKLSKFALLATKNIEFAISIIKASEDYWFFQTLLAGCIIKDGYLLPGKFLSKAGEAGELLGLIALVHKPLNTQSNINLEKVKYWKFQERLLELFASHVYTAAPWLRIKKNTLVIGLKNISDASAQVLSNFEGNICLDGLENLSNYTALALSKHKGWLTVSGLKNISDIPGHLALIEKLSKHNGDLKLNNLEYLFNSAARALSKHKGGILHLEGLRSLGDSPDHLALIERLSKQKTDLKLNALENINDNAVAALTNHQGELHLHSLQNLSLNAAKLLSQHSWPLYLNGLKSLSLSTAKLLSNHKGDLHLDGLITLSDSVADALSKHSGNLTFANLTAISDATAKALCKYKGNLGLNGLKDLSDAAAHALSKTKGELMLDGLTNLNDSPGHLALVEKFSIQECNVSFPSLTNLGDKIAFSLSKHRGWLGLDGIKNLSDLAALALSMHQGNISLDSLVYLNDSPGHLALTDKLRKQDWILNLGGLKKISEVAAKLLSKKIGGIEKIKVSEPLKKQILKYRK